MGREIKFRGYYKGDQYLPAKWVYGGILFRSSCVHIIEDCNGHTLMWNVDPDSVGQYTGVEDRNGQGIYEGDIVEDEDHYYGCVYWDNDGSMWCVADYGGLGDYQGAHLCVIGNIHENPGLLENYQ